MKKLNYLIVLFAVLFTLGFSSCTDDEVAPDEQKRVLSEKDQIADLLIGNTYKGETTQGGQETTIYIRFIDSGSDSGYFYLDVVKTSRIYGTPYWEINDDGDIELREINNEDYDITLDIIGDINEDGFSFTNRIFNDGTEPVRVDRIKI